MKDILETRLADYFSYQCVSNKGSMNVANPIYDTHLI